jgi:S1-C subfamily serine protease
MITWFRPSLALPDSSQVSAAVRAAGESTVKVIASRCGIVAEGSGFIAAPGLVLTNAHVAPLGAAPVVVDREGPHRASTVLLNPAMDIAILQTSGLAGDPLPLSARAAGRGDQGVVLGFPGKAKLRATPAAVRESLAPDRTRPIFDSPIPRPVYQLRTRVRPGHSGSPFVRPDGEVVGVIFSRAQFKEDVAYALRSTDLASFLEEANLTASRSPPAIPAC